MQLEEQLSEEIHACQKNLERIRINLGCSLWPITWLPPMPDSRFTLLFVGQNLGPPRQPRCSPEHALLMQPFLTGISFPHISFPMNQDTSLCQFHCHLLSEAFSKPGLVPPPWGFHSTLGSHRISLKMMCLQVCLSCQAINSLKVLFIFLCLVPSRGPDVQELNNYLLNLHE